MSDAMEAGTPTPLGADRVLELAGTPEGPGLACHHRRGVHLGFGEDASAKGQWIADTSPWAELAPVIARGLDRPFLNGVRLFVGQGGDFKNCEVRINGVLHEPSSAALAVMDWPRTEKMSTARVFLLLVHPEETSHRREGISQGKRWPRSTPARGAANHSGRGCEATVRQSALGQSAESRRNGHSTGPLAPVSSSQLRTPGSIRTPSSAAHAAHSKDVGLVA